MIKVCVLNWNDVVPDLSQHFKILGITDFLQADAIIAAHDANPTQAEVCRTAKEYGIPVFVLQHGRFSASDYLYNGVKPQGDYFLAWGDNDVEMAVGGGWKREQVIKVGAPPLMDWVRPKPDGKTVVFAPAHIEALQSKNANNDNESLQIWERLRTIKGIDPVIKLLQGEHPVDEIHGEKFVTSRNDKGHIKKVYRWLLKRTSCVVSQAEGTFELLAYSMNIPVVRVNDFDKRWNTAADIRVGIENLEAAVLDAIENPAINEHRRRELVEKEGGGLPCKATQNIVAVINQKVISKALRGGKEDKCSVITSFIKEMNRESYYRLTLPLDKIAEHDSEIAVKRIVKGMPDSKIAHGLITDVLALPPIYEPKLIDIANRLQEMGKKVCLDFDENIFHVNPFSPKYHTYGLENVKVGNTVIWENRNNIDLFSNQVNIENAMMALSLADLVTVPTAALARVYEKYSKNVKVIPTCIDTLVWKKLPMIKDGSVRIGLCGGTDAAEDVTLISEAIQKVMASNSNVVFVILGARFGQTFKDLPQDRIEYHPYVPFEAMPYKMAALNLDIGLIPHRESPYSIYKTPVKWLEYAALEVPTVCSLTYPYNSLGEDAGVFIEGNGADEWAEGVNALVEDSILRSKIAGDARRIVSDRYDINKEYKAWANTYRGLYN